MKNHKLSTVWLANVSGAQLSSGVSGVRVFLFGLFIPPEHLQVFLVLLHVEQSLVSTGGSMWNKNARVSGNLAEIYTEE
jgi:hypothetical protein